MGQFKLRNSRPDAQRVVADAKTRADGVEKRKRKPFGDPAAKKPKPQD